jgi:ABC-type branched-subunit amino acid transport system substrate-binding protein
VSTGKIDVLITVCTAAAQSLLPIVKNEAIPLIQVTEAGPDPSGYMIKMMPSKKGSLVALADYYAKKYQTMAIIADIQTANEGADGNVAELKRAFINRGKVVVYEQMVSPELLDFRAILPRLKKLNPDVVMPILVTSTQMATFMRQADDFHLWDVSALGGNFAFEFLYSKLLELYPRISKLDGLESNNLEQPENSSFSLKYQERFKELPPQFADYGYDVGIMLKTCAADIPCLVTNRPGVSGELRFDNLRRRQGTYVVKHLVNGKFVAQSR